MIRYQIWRKPQPELGEEAASGDVFICIRGTRKSAEDWIESQKDQLISSTHYYVKEVRFGKDSEPAVNQVKSNDKK